MEDLLLAIFWIIILCVSVALTGFFAGGFIKQQYEKPDERFLRDQLLGLLLLVTTFALIKTNGQTILLGIFIPVIAGYKYLTLKPKFPQLTYLKKYFKPLLLLIFVSFIFAIPEFLWMYDSSKDALLTVPHYDFLSYARISGFMNDLGAENPNLSLNKLYPDEINIKSPYHYPEIWLNGLMHSITGKSTIKTEMLAVFPYLKGLLISVLTVSIKNRFSNIKNVNAYFLAFILSSISGVYFSFYQDSTWLKFHDGITQSGALMSFGRKYLFIYVFIAYGFHVFWKSGRPSLPFFMIISFIPLFSIGTLPAILFASAGLLVLFFLSKKINSKTNLLGFLIIASVSAFVFLFYHFLGNKTSTENIKESLLIFDVLRETSFNNLKQLFFAIYFPGIRSLVMYIPWLLIIFCLIKKKCSKTSIVLAFLLLLGGSIASGAAKGALDTGQFLYNILPIFNVCLSVALIDSLSIQDISIVKKRMTTFLTLIFSAYHLFSDYDYYKKAIIPYNKITAEMKSSNLTKLEREYGGKDHITGLFRLAPEALKEGTFRDTYYKYDHFYLQFLDNFSDAINITVQPFISKRDALSSVDRFLLGHNELAIFLQKENLPYGEKALKSFSERTGAVFLADGDSLITGDLIKYKYWQP
jgi:hypothetical protein